MNVISFPDLIIKGQGSPRQATKTKSSRSLSDALLILSAVIWERTFWGVCTDECGSWCAGIVRIAERFPPLVMGLRVTAASELTPHH